MTPQRSGRLKREDIVHLLRSVVAITRLSKFVLIGTGAVIARSKTIPLDLMQTREIDIYAVEADDPDMVSTLIDGALGEGSQFDSTFGYYAHGVGERTACLPDDWQVRAATLSIPGTTDGECICPDADDIALSKACAWREKDRDWLTSALKNGVVRLDAMRDRAAKITNPNAPALDELVRRLDVLAAGLARA